MVDGANRRNLYGEEIMNRENEMIDESSGSDNIHQQ